MTCTGCPALRYPVQSGMCALGVRTGTTINHGLRVRHPLSTCQQPRTDAELTERMGIIARERR